MIIVFLFLIFYIVVQVESYRIFFRYNKLYKDLAAHVTLLNGSAAVDVETPLPAPSLVQPAVFSVTKTVGALVVTSRLSADSPFVVPSAEIISPSDSSRNVPVIVICSLLLAGMIIGLIWYIWAKSDSDCCDGLRSPRKDAHVCYNRPVSSVEALGNRASVASVSPAPPVLSKPTSHPPVKNNRGAATAVGHPSAAPIINKSKDGRNAAPSVELERRPNPPAPRVSNSGISNPANQAGVNEFKVISFNELARRNNAIAAARVSDPPETSKPRPSRDADFGPKSFSYEELWRATRSFSPANVIGEGGYAKVYKGNLSDKTKVAVKVFKRENTEGDREFRHEVNTISLAKHKNIVRLVGYCIDDVKRCIVYEFVENRSLQYHLLGGKGIKTMEWPVRMKIAKGTAKGIAYLHDECPQSIIHRDVKPANILLDLEFGAKVADFGIAKLCPESFMSHIASYALGTLGWIDPVYAETKELTFKSDVYSFGVVLLQLVSGVTELPTLYKLRMEQLPRALEFGSFRCIADPKLNRNYVRDEMALMLTCAEACLRKDPKDRPPMSQVSRVLEEIVSADELKIRNIRKRGL